MKQRINKNWLLVTAIAALPVLAAGGLSVKTGTWETTINTKAAGMTMPAEAMAKMNAQQRAQMEAMMSKASAPHSMTTKSCVTQKDLDEGAFRADKMEKDSKCSYKPGAANSTRHQEWTIDCPGQQGISGGTMVVDAADSTHVSGVMHIKANTATVDSTFTSKWLSATCAAEDKD